MCGVGARRGRRKWAGGESGRGFSLGGLRGEGIFFLADGLMDDRFR